MHSTIHSKFTTITLQLVYMFRLYIQINASFLHTIRYAPLAVKKVLIDPKAIMYLLGTEMDYKEEELSSSFVFKNPNETERCGCGESFKI